MKERFFKITESMAEVIMAMDDRRAGRFIKAVSDYAFGGKIYGGNDAVIKSNFVLVKKELDEQAFYSHCGRLGARKKTESESERRQKCELPDIRKIILGSDISGILNGLFSAGQDEKTGSENT